jgi:hypothetical protein
MGREVTGIVIEKAYHPPPGAPDRYWCYLMIETEVGERTNVRLHQSLHNRISIGDRVRFTKPWRENKRVRDLEVVERARLE